MAEGEKSNTVKIAIVIGVIVIAGAVFALTRGGGVAVQPDAEMYYYLDLGAADTDSALFQVGIDKDPPVDAPSGHRTADGHPGGVRAYVFSCGACTPDQLYVGYVERYTPQALSALADLRSKYPGQHIDDLPAGEVTQFANIPAGHQIASPDLEGGWVAWNSEAGARIRSAAMDRCEGARPSACFPGR